MKNVILESPYKGDVKRNVAYAQWCGLDMTRRGESPYASHLLLTQFLDDDVAEERELGINCGYSWYRSADYVVFYADYGFSSGMRYALEHCRKTGLWYVFRTLWTAYEDVELPDGETRSRFDSSGPSRRTA